MPLSRCLIICLTLVTGLLAACRPIQPLTPSPTSQPTAVATSPIPTATPRATPPAWIRREAPGMSIELPAEWEVLSLGQADLERVFADLQQRNPKLAQTIGSATALQGVSLWAFNSAHVDVQFVDNLNIRRSAGSRVEALATVLDAVANQYREIGLTVLRVQPDLTIGGLQAGLIAYTLSVHDSNRPVRAEAIQYLVSAETDLWILTFTVGPDQTAALRDSIERCAGSFRAK